jgi:hypothetical protein
MVRQGSAVSGAVMEDGSYLKKLACECGNEGAAVYLRIDKHSRLLHDLDGDFRRHDKSDDPAIICDLCGQAVKDE